MEEHAVTEVDNVLVSDITSCVYDREAKVHHHYQSS